MKGKITIIESPLNLRKKIIKEVEGRLDKAIKKAIPNIKKDIEETLFFIFTQTKIYKELTTGELKAHFGFPTGSEFDRVNDIISTLSKNIKITYSKKKASLNIGLIEDNLDAIINLPGSVVITEQGTVLNWLEWLLYRGSQIIIAGYDVQIGQYNPGQSRSLEAIMIEIEGTGWAVPTQYAGTEGNNWITDTMKDSSQLLTSYIEKIIEKRIKQVS